MGKGLDALGRDRAIDDFVVARSRWTDMTNDGRVADNGKLKDIVGALKTFYEIITAAGSSSLDINAFVPHPRADVLRPNSLRKNSGSAEVNETLALLGAHAAASSDKAALSAPARAPGGIDLNFQPRFIRRTSDVFSAGSGQASVVSMPDGFKGFNFNIIRFTSQLTVKGAFQLMFSSH